MGKERGRDRCAKSPVAGERKKPIALTAGEKHNPKGAYG